MCLLASGPLGMGDKSLLWLMVTTTGGGDPVSLCPGN